MPLTEAFRQGLRELGYAEGKNIVIEFRYAGGKLDRLLDFAAELVRMKVDVIVPAATKATRAAMNATKTIPIVFLLSGNPVRQGLVASIARPGGNVTGLSHRGPGLVGKQLELVKEAVPNASRVAVLWNPANPAHPFMLREAKVAGRALGVQLQVLEVRGPDEFEGAFAAMTRERADALLVLSESVFYVHRERLAELSTKSRLPTMHGLRVNAEAGGLMAYAANLPDLFRRGATYVDRILKGAKPEDLPVQLPAKFDLVINLKTAKALGITIPPDVLLQAAMVIK